MRYWSSDVCPADLERRRLLAAAAVGGVGGAQRVPPRAEVTGDERGETGRAQPAEARELELLGAGAVGAQAAGRDCDGGHGAPLGGADLLSSPPPLTGRW